MAVKGPHFLFNMCKYTLCIIAFSENLMASIGIKPKPKVIDLTNKIGIAEKVVESRIHCKPEEKVNFIQ